MSEEYNKVDKEYKDGLIDIEFDVDVEEMWADLEPQLEPKKKRRPLFVWFLFTALLFIGLFFTWNHFISTPNFVDQLPIAENKNNSYKNKSASDKTSSIYQNDNESRVLKKSELDIESKNLSINNVNNNRQNHSELTTSQIIDSKKNRVEKNHEDHNSKNNQSNNQELGEFQSDIEFKNSFDVSHPYPIYENKNPKTLNNIENDLDRINRDKIIKDLSKIEHIITGLTYTNNELVMPALVRIKIPKKWNINFNNTVYYALSTSQNRYVSQLPSFESRLTLGYNVTKSIQLHAGVDYLQINEKFDFESITTSKEKIYTPDAFFTEDNGFVEYFSDSVYAVRTYLNKRQKQNSYKLWSIPVGISLSTNYNQWNFGIGASAIFNLSTSFEGYILNEDENDIISISGDHTAFETQIGLGFRIRPSISYTLNSKTKIELAIPLRSSSFSDINNDQKWNAVGLNAGINFAF